MEKVRQCCSYICLNPKIILKIMLVISTISLICYGVPVIRTANEKCNDDRLMQNEHILHLLYSLGYNDYRIVLPIFIVTCILCIVGWIGALMDRMVLMQIFTWYMFVCGVALFLLTICTYGGEMYMQRKIALAHLDQKWEAMKDTFDYPYTYNLGYVLQKTFQCCGRVDDNDWNMNNFKKDSGGYRRPKGCCSPRYGPYYDCTKGRTWWKEGCYDAIRRVLMEHVSAIRTANLKFCLNLFHAATWGGALTLEILRTWVPPPSPEEKAQKKVTDAKAKAEAQLEAQKQADQKKKEKEQKELENQAKKKKASESKTSEQSKQKETAEKQTKEEALKKAQEKDEKQKKKMKEKEEKALEQAKQKEAAKDKAKE